MGAPDFRNNVPGKPMTDQDVTDVVTWLAAQRHLINNFKLATELGAEVIKVKQSNIARGIMECAEKHNITTICIGKPHLTLYNVIVSTAVFNQLLQRLAASDIDVVILS